MANVTEDVHYVGITILYLNTPSINVGKLETDEILSNKYNILNTLNIVDK